MKLDIGAVVLVIFLIWFTGSLWWLLALALSIKFTWEKEGK